MNRATVRIISWVPKKVTATWFAAWNHGQLVRVHLIAAYSRLAAAAKVRHLISPIV